MDNLTLELNEAIQKHGKNIKGETKQGGFEWRFRRKDTDGKVTVLLTNKECPPNSHNVKDNFCTECGKPVIF